MCAAAGPRAGWPQAPRAGIRLARARRARPRVPTGPARLAAARAGEAGAEGVAQYRAGPRCVLTWWDVLSTAPAEREQDIERQCQKLRAVYQRAKMLAEKETESCIQCLAKVDELIFKKTGEHMPPPAVALVGSKRTFSAGHLDGSLNGAGPPKRQMSVDVPHDPMPATPLVRHGSFAQAPATAAKTPKPGQDPQKLAERQVMRLSAEERVLVQFRCHSILFGSCA